MNLDGLKICEQRKALLETSGHLLILGRPGSGKTTIALVKAAIDLSTTPLQLGQKILFLSFARATVARVMQEARHRIQPELRAQIEISTYHGFAWSFIRTFGYLATGRRKLQLLTPPEMATANAGIAREDRPANVKRLLAEEGLLGFDLFAGLMADLLEGSARLRDLLSDSYPTIIVDEFQDTNADEWRMIAALGGKSRIVAMADPEQRIYEFRGADPARIGNFVEKFDPKMFDFGKENNRSDGTDIVLFGNDLLTGANIGKSYNDVVVNRYAFYRPELLLPVKYSLLGAMKRVIESGKKDWSIAILVSSRDMMVQVSALLARSTSGLPEIGHDVLIDPEGPALAAILIGGLLEGAQTPEELTRKFMTDLLAHIRGRKGGEISQTDLALASALDGYMATGLIRGSKRSELVANIQAIVAARMATSFAGEPETDWLAMRRLIDAASHGAFGALSEDARFIRLLRRGTELRENLADRWRDSGTYAGARQIVSSALLQEHFSAATRVWSGVNVMTIHKSKGKEFDEVLIFEGVHSGRLTRNDPTPRELDQSRLNLRVGVTRARKRTTILTPGWNACPLL